MEGKPIENLGLVDSDDFYSDQNELIQDLYGSSDDSVTRHGRPSTLNESVDACIDDQDIQVEGHTATVMFTVAENYSYTPSFVSYTEPTDGWGREMVYRINKAYPLYSASDFWHVSDR